jgi:hypothetical protein
MDKETIAMGLLILGVLFISFGLLGTDITIFKLGVIVLFAMVLVLLI